MKKTDDGYPSIILEHKVGPWVVMMGSPNPILMSMECSLPLLMNTSRRASDAFRHKWYVVLQSADINEERFRLAGYRNNPRW